MIFMPVDTGDRSLMKKALTILLLLSIIFTSSFSITSKASKTDSKKTEESSSLWPKGPKIAAPSAILMEASTGLVLYEKSANKKRYPASVTKIMTALLAVENSAMNETVKFSKNAIYGIEPGSSHIAMRVGEELTMEQALNAVMLASANEVSLAVGEHVGGDAKTFIQMMNDRAKELGCKNTNFVNTNGLFDENHYTTAYDMALIARAALNNEAFRKVTSTKIYTIPSTNLVDESRVFGNHHQMLTGTKKPQYKYEGCIGGKTGYTVKAKHSLATFASRDGLELICIVMNNESSNANYESTTALLDFGFDNFTVHDTGLEKDNNIIDASNFFTSQDSSLFNTSSSPLQIEGTSSVILPNTADYSEVKKTINYTPNMELTLGRNVLGTINYEYDNKQVGSSQIVYNNAVAPKANTAKMVSYSEMNSDLEKQESKFNLKPIIIAVIIVILAGLYGVYYFLVERPRLLRRRAFYDKRRRSKLDFDQKLFK